MKKWLTLILALALAMTCSCAFAAEYNEAGTFPICKEKVPLTIAIADRMNVENFETNQMTLDMEERGNFDLSFDVSPSTDFNSKINLMILSKSKKLPDIIMATPTDDMLLEWISSGMLVPLTEYYKAPDISYWLHEAYKRTGVDFSTQLVMPDGEIYTVPNFNQSSVNEYPDKLWIYKPWLDQMGLPIPTTTDELYNTLKRIVTEDPNGNGIADEIGIAGCFMESDYDRMFSALMNSFVYSGDPNYLTVNEGKVSFAYTTEAWKEGLKFVRKLYAENIIPVETLTQDANQYNAMINSALPTVFMLVYTSPSRINADNKYRDDYICIEPMAGPEGVRFVTYEPSVATSQFFVTKNCKDPEAAFRLGDLMASEYFSICQRWGQQGKDWDYVKDLKDGKEYAAMIPGNEPYILAYDDATFWSSGTMQNRSWLLSALRVRQYGIADGRAVDPASVTAFKKHEGDAIMTYRNSGLEPAQVVPKLLYTLEESDVVSEPLSTLTSYVREMTANFLAGNLDVDAEWENFQKEVENIGAAKVLEVVNQVYDRMYGQ